MGAVKDKFDGVVIKSKAATTTTRQPLRTTATTRKTTRVTTLVGTESTIAEVEEEVQPVHRGADEHAMAIDPPTARDAPARSPRIPSIAARRSIHARESVTTFARVGDRHRPATRGPPVRTRQLEDEREILRSRATRRAFAANDAVLEDWGTVSG